MATASQLIDEKIRLLGGWRAEALATEAFEALVRSAVAANPRVAAAKQGRRA